MGTLFNGDTKDVVLFEVLNEDQHIYRICWGIGESTCYYSAFSGDLNAENLCSTINNTKFTMLELHTIATSAGLSEEETIKFLKTMISRLVVEYDSSSAVNEFYIGGLPVWLDKGTRVGLLLRFSSEKAMGLKTTTLWLDGMQFTFDLSNAELILGAIEVYASMCYDNTQKHLMLISKLESIDEVMGYDFTTGYPDKIDLAKFQA